MADNPKRPRVPEKKKKVVICHEKSAIKLEQQNAIYREVFAKANIPFPEMKSLGNYRIPKKANTGQFVWQEDQSKVEWVEKPAPEKYVQKSILGLPYPEVEQYEQERLKGGYNRRPLPPPPRPSADVRKTPRPSADARNPSHPSADARNPSRPSADVRNPPHPSADVRKPEPQPSTSASYWAPRRVDKVPKTLNASVGSSRIEPPLATVRAHARPRYRFQSDRKGDFDRMDYASAVGSMKSIATDIMEDRRSSVSETSSGQLSPEGAAGSETEEAAGGEREAAAGGEPKGDRNSGNMLAGENRQD